MYSTLLSCTIVGGSSWSSTPSSYSKGVPAWCSFLGVQCDTDSTSATHLSVIYLRLTNESLAGTIPSSIGSLTALRGLYIGGNHLTGSIPSSIGSLTSLLRIYLNTNSLTGTIPSSIGSLSLLSYLLLNSTSISGTIPSSIGSMTSLIHVQLEDNFLTGTIPSTFNQLTKLTYLTLQSNYLTMGSATTVPPSTFSNETLLAPRFSGILELYDNCLVFNYQSTSASATHCSPTSSKCEA